MTTNRNVLKWDGGRGQRMSLEPISKKIKVPLVVF